MLDAARKALELVDGRTLADLENDEIRTLALIRLLEVVGEAATGVSTAVKHSHPELPWAEMTGTRNRLIHGYFYVDLSVVWRIATEDLPPVIDTLRGLVEIE